MLRTDTWTDQHPQLFQAGPIFQQDSQGILQDSGHRAAPTGMRRRDDASFRIGEEHRRAIGGEHCGHHAGAIGDHRVGIGTGAVPAGDGHGIAMHLIDQGQFPGMGGQGGEQRRPVVGDVRGIVAHMISEIEPGPAPRAHPALSGGEKGENSRTRDGIFPGKNDILLIFRFRTVTMVCFLHH